MKSKFKNKKTGPSYYILTNCKNKIIGIKNICVIYAAKQNTGNLTV